MKYDFNKEISRQDTNSVKWNAIQKRQALLHLDNTEELIGENSILPLWVADMDFPSPKPVVDALIARAEHGIYGYTAPTESYYGSVVNWMKRRHEWEILPEWICFTPGVVPALNMLVRTFISQGDKVLVQTPVYYPFFNAIENNGGEIARNPLINKNGVYHMDFADLEEKAKDPQVKMAILCSPHNPVGRVWNRDELIHFGEICIRNNVLIVSDEIHGDLIYKGSVFTPFAAISGDFASNTIICTAPSKTFNIAGLQISNIIIPDGKLRATFEKTLKSNGLSGIDAFGVVALEAAYNYGEEWLDQVLAYIEDNFRYLEEFVNTHIPQINVIQPEGTYLVWMDCRKLGLGKRELKQLMLNEARVYLNEGFIFGPEGEGFERINIACPRSLLVEALDRIKNAIDRRGTLAAEI